MRTLLGYIAETTTAYLALSAGVAAGAGGVSEAGDVGGGVRPYGALPYSGQASDIATLPAISPPKRKHAVGHAVPNHCGIEAAAPHAMGMAVAHYDEDLSWLGDRRINATLYCKNTGYAAPDKELYREWVELPNVGLESHTYLYHIISHWNCLDDVTLFTQGRADDSVDNYQGIDELMARTLSNPEGMILYRNPGTFNEWWGVWHFGKWKDELDSGVMRKSDRNPGEFWRWMFAGEPPPETIAWTWSATFAVRREAIRRRPLRFYQRILHHFEALNHTKPEEGHFMERFWLSVFKSDAGLRPGSRRDLRARRAAIKEG